MLSQDKRKERHRTSGDKHLDSVRKSQDIPGQKGQKDIGLYGTKISTV